MEAEAEEVNRRKDVEKMKNAKEIVVIKKVIEKKTTTSESNSKSKKMSEHRAKVEVKGSKK